MKTNHRRKNPNKRGFNYSYQNYMARVRAGVPGMEHDGGHQGNSVDIKQEKTHRRRQQRRINNRDVFNEVNLGEIE